MNSKIIKGLIKDNFNKIIIEHILDGLNNEKQIELLEKVILNYPSLRLSSLNMELFNEKYIKCFGIEFLSKNITTLKKIYLDYGLKDEDIKNKLLLINKIGIPFDNINSKFLLSPIITKDVIICFSEILKEKNFSYLICNYCVEDEEYLELIKKIIDQNSDYYKLISFLFKFFEKDEYVKFKSVLNSSNIKEYIYFFENIEPSWFNINTDFDKLIKIFNKNKYLFNEISKKGKKKNIKELLKIYFFDNEIHVDNIKDLNNIVSLRYQIFRNKISDTNDIKKIKELFVKCYFNMDINSFELKIKDLKENIKDGLSFNSYDTHTFRLLEYFLSLKNKDKIISLFDNLKEIPYIYGYIDILEERQKKYCFKNITNSLTNVGKYPEIIEFDGQDFNFLIHRIKGYGNKDLANRLYDDPSLWDKYIFDDSYISASMITNDYFGCIPGSGPILAFNNISEEDILDMGNEDIDYSTTYCKKNIKSPKSRIMTKKNLIKNSNKLYNEVVIKRYVNNKIVMPSAIIAFDKVTQNDIKFSKQFNVPIYLINTKKYLDKMLEKCNSYLQIGDYDNYYNYKLKIVHSFANNREILQKYFNADELNKDTNLIIDNILKELKNVKTNKQKLKLVQQLKNAISVNKKINSVVMYNDVTSDVYNFNEKEIEKRLNLYINT